ncbi:MAG: response regulator [Lachnospiraceae bacterium]|nr:response regulator [Lachnospiraceae bacterium]
MKSLMIVEDEKMIRQGIVTMAKRAPVTIDEIIECRNGEEALEVLRSRPVEVMFTDIRMPKMDGITLIRQLGSLEEPPKTIVVSGYDDFSYAVEALRSGVQDYLLKPVEREKVYEILKKLDDELQREQQEKQQEKQSGRSISRQQLRYLIVNRNIPERELEELEGQSAMQGHFRICCCCMEHPLEAEGVMQLCEIGDQSVFFVREELLQEFLETQLGGCCVGVSGSFGGIREIRAAYEAALSARIHAFMTGQAVVCADRMPGVSAAEAVPEQFAEQFVLLFGTDKADNAMKQLEHYYFLARHGNINEAELMRATAMILEQIPVSYKNVLEANQAEYMRLRAPLAYNDAESFLKEFRVWFLRTKEMIDAEFGDYRNKEKINMAVAYIRENFDKELNMAVVSNHISMNYSLFSLSFKQYTGMNFVNYLKMIRINEAKRLLEETDEKVIEISQKVGYENEKHFMKTFKNVCGVSPSEYRKNMQMRKPPR